MFLLPAHFSKTPVMTFPGLVKAKCADRPALRWYVIVVVFNDFIGMSGNVGGKVVVNSFLSFSC